MNRQTPRFLLAVLGALFVPLVAASQGLSEADALLRFEQENASLKGFAAQVRGFQADVRIWSRPSNPSVTYSQ